MLSKLTLIARGDAGVKATTESWRAKPLKTDLALDVLMGKTVS